MLFSWNFVTKKPSDLLTCWWQIKWGLLEVETLNSLICWRNAYTQYKARLFATMTRPLRGEPKLLLLRSKSEKVIRKSIILVNKNLEQREMKTCICDDFEPGWEAAAPINHGSLLEIGCHKFLFATHWNRVPFLLLLFFYPIRSQPLPFFRQPPINTVHF